MASEVAEDRSEQAKRKGVVSKPWKMKSFILARMILREDW